MALLPGHISEFALVPRGVGRILGNQSLVKADAKGFSQHAPIFRIGIMTRPHMTLLDKEGNPLHLGGSVLACRQFLLIVPQTPQFPRLSVIIIVIGALIIVVKVAMQLRRRLDSRRIILPLSETCLLYTSPSPRD